MTLFHFWRKQDTPIVPPEPLKPGICECGHRRCYHVKGSAACTVGFPAKEGWPNGSSCACEIFILDPDGDDDDDEGYDDPTPSPEELEKLYRR